MPPDAPRGSGREAWGVTGVAAAVAVCCGSGPLLVGAGIALGAAGIVVGSSLLVALGAGLGLVAWRHRRAPR